jgi:hypothetical protein
MVTCRTCAKKTLIGHTEEDRDCVDSQPPGGWPGSSRETAGAGPERASLSAGSEPHGDAGEDYFDSFASILQGGSRRKSTNHQQRSTPDGSPAHERGWEEASGTGYPQDVEELALKTFSSDRSTFGVNAEQRRRLSQGCTVEAGNEVCCLSGTPLEFMINAVDVFGESVVNRTQLDVIASKLSTHISVLGPHTGLQVQSFPEAHFRREDLYIVGTIRITHPGNYKITVNIAMLGGQDQMLQPRNGVCISVLGRRPS